MTAFSTVPLQRLFRVGGGTTPSAAAENWGGGIPWITPTDLRPAHGREVLKTARTVTKGGLRSSGLRLLPAGSIVLSCRAPIGYVATTSVAATMNQGCKGLVALADLDARYYRYCLVAAADCLKSLGRGSTFLELSTQDLAELRLPAPPLRVQQRIADYLDTETARIDALVNRNTELGALVRERNDRFVLAAVSQGVDGGTLVDADGVAWLDHVNGAFATGPYAMYGRTGSGHTPSRSVPEYWADCDIPWVTTGDVKWLRSGFMEYLEDTAEKISRLGMANSAARLHPAGTVFLSRTASVGFAGIMAVPMATSQDFFTWTPDSRLRSEYLLWSLRAMRSAGHFDRLMYGSTHKTIYVPDLMVLRGPIPPVEEQDRIVSAIREQRDGTVSLLARLERANRLLGERREALITAAVTGELEV